MLYGIYSHFITSYNIHSNFMMPYSIYPHFIMSYSICSNFMMSYNIYSTFTICLVQEQKSPETIFCLFGERGGEGPDLALM